jgi:O-antigen/teichoic acid export membrane protein
MPDMVNLVVKCASGAAGKGRPGLASAARGAALYGAGFTLLHDALQFGTMLLLVRLLSPEDYGRVAFAGTILGLISIASVKTFLPHVLQHRDPAGIDWQMQFTAATAMNIAMFGITLIVAGLLSLTSQYAGAALPLAALAAVLLIEIPSSIRQTMMQVQHDWARFRALTFAGAVIGNATAVLIALTGGGFWALVASAPLFGVPAALDLFFLLKWRPNWSWNWAGYKETLQFGLTRMGSAGLLSGRQTTEQAILTGWYNFGTLGVFTRSIGLANLAAGRIGYVFLSSLYPVITRAEPESHRSSRIAGLVLCLVAWISIPSAAFLALEAEPAVLLLYGPQWTGVTELLPLAAAQVTLGGLNTTVYGLLLANNRTRTCLSIDMLTAILGVLLAILVIPIGPRLYLAGLGMQNAIVLIIAAFTLVSTRGISLKDVFLAVAPPCFAAAVGIGGVLGVRIVLGDPKTLVLHLAFEGISFALLYAAIIRICWPNRLREILRPFPGAAGLRRVMLLV